MHSGNSGQDESNWKLPKFTVKDILENEINRIYWKATETIEHHAFTRKGT